MQMSARNDATHSVRVSLLQTNLVAGIFLAFLPFLVQDLGTDRHTVLQYWHAAAKSPSDHPKGLKTGIILITWELWKERNARVFNNKASTSATLMQKIEDESKNRVLAGAKHLADITI